MAQLKIIDCDSGSIRVLANSTIYTIYDFKELPALLESKKVQEESKRTYLFKEDVELQIDMVEMIPKVAGVHAKSFKNTCGVDVVETIKAIRTRRIQHPHVE